MSGEKYEFLKANEPYVIAEVGGNHGGSLDKAKEYVTAATDAGADAVKFQLYQAENLITRDEPPLPLAGDEYDTQFERFKELELSRGEWNELIELCDSLDIDFSASVFDTEMLNFVLDDIPFIKIASGDMTNLPLLRHAMESGKPIVLSTGFSSFEEIKTTMAHLSGSDVIPLHCVGCYPTADEHANLSMIQTLADEFGGPSGYSDHTVGTLAAVVAAAKGARVIEKHFTLDKSQDVGDHRLSANPSEIREIVKQTQRAFQMDGTPRGSDIYPCEDRIHRSMRRSLAAATDITDGQTIREEDLTALRPLNGISPLRLDEIVGKTAVRSISAKTILHESDVS
jgi:sialic acid synthase SpsE